MALDKALQAKQRVDKLAVSVELRWLRPQYMKNLSESTNRKFSKGVMILKLHLVPWHKQPAATTWLLLSPVEE